MTEEVKHDKCGKCKCWRLPQQFLNNKGRKLKTCDDCRKRNKKNADNRKCEHKKQKSTCKECGGSQICEHNRIKSTCKECGGSQICEHNRIKSTCKECGGSQICEHNRRKRDCKECGGSQICAHNKRRGECKECGGSQICEHNRIKSQCKECGGSQICEHNRRKIFCKECGGSQICEHKRYKSQCKECGGSQICEHNRQKSTCKYCDPQGHLAMIVRTRIRDALKSDKSKKSIEYLGCSIEEFKKHIEEQFKDEMSWENYGEWHIDHIIPLKYDNPTIEETINRLHYLNTQPLWAKDNITKGNRYIG